MTETTFTTMQLDALREVANTGSGYAAADISDMIGTSVDISVPRVIATSLADAVDELGGPGEVVTSVMVPTTGAVEAVLVSIYRLEQAEAMCQAMGMEASSELGRSLLAEAGNVLACAYGGVIAEMASLSSNIEPPLLVTDMLGAMVTTLSMKIDPDAASVLLIDSQLAVRGSDIGLTVLFVPTKTSIASLLEGLGIG